MLPSHFRSAGCLAYSSRLISSGQTPICPRFRPRNRSRPSSTTPTTTGCPGPTTTGNSTGSYFCTRTWTHNTGAIQTCSLPVTTSIYLVEGGNKTRQAPDVYVAFGPPKRELPGVGRDRSLPTGGLRSLVASQSVAADGRQVRLLREIRGRRVRRHLPGVSVPRRRLAARERTIRSDCRDKRHVSARLGIRFVLDTGELTVFGPDGRRAATESGTTAPTS